MSYKDEILQTLFGGGILDYEMLDKCDYSFEDILQKIEMFTSREEMEFNDILIGAIDIYRENIQNIIDKKIEEGIEELKELNAYDDIESFANYLDTHIFMSNEETRKIYKEFLEKEIEEEDEKIGFCWLDLGE